MFLYIHIYLYTELKTKDDLNFVILSKLLFRIISLGYLHEYYITNAQSWCRLTSINASVTWKMIKRG